MSGGGSGYRWDRGGRYTARRGHKRPHGPYMGCPEMPCQLLEFHGNFVRARLRRRLRGRLERVEDAHPSRVWYADYNEFSCPA